MIRGRSDQNAHGDDVQSYDRDYHVDHEHPGLDHDLIGSAKEATATAC